MTDEVWDAWGEDEKRRETVARIRGRLFTLGKVFRPAGPIDQQALFRGRFDQLARVNSLIHEVARHGIIFGERGVGKTSLAAVSADIVSDDWLPVRINCDTSDKFASLWEKVIDRLLTLAGVHADDEGLVAAIEQTVEMLSFDQIGPGRVNAALTVLATARPPLLIFDEFDRIQMDGVGVLMADTIKGLADQLTRATIIVVGVADDVESLITEHASVSRSLAQVRMPRMAVDEIGEIIGSGFHALDLTAPSEVMHLLVHLPQGLPAYAHGLAQLAAGRAITNDRYEVTMDDLHYAVDTTVRNADETMTRLYTDAVATAHKNTLYERVLLACALAAVDETGYFTPIGVKEPLCRIMGEEVEQARYARHLQQFCEERGPLLEQRGYDRHWRYRFIFPMMRPYLIMRAYSSGSTLDLLALTPVVPPDPEPQQLFDP